MSFGNRIIDVRKSKNMTQEQLAGLLGISRQSVAKWESGSSYPDIDNLVALSNYLGVSLDYLLKDKTDGCSGEKDISQREEQNNEWIDFLCRAKKKTYAGKGMEDVKSSRPASHDLSYKEGSYLYIDTYLGGKLFSGEEAVWRDEVPLWSMNYIGRVIHENFSGDFLKEALLRVDRKYPYRGPSIYIDGPYTYHCRAEGDVSWFKGSEEIYFEGDIVYECNFHGGYIL